MDKTLLNDIMEQVKDNLKSLHFTPSYFHSLVDGALETKTVQWVTFYYDNNDNAYCLVFDSDDGINVKYKFAIHDTFTENGNNYEWDFHFPVYKEDVLQKEYIFNKENDADTLFANSYIDDIRDFFIELLDMVECKEDNKNTLLL